MPEARRAPTAARAALPLPRAAARAPSASRKPESAGPLGPDEVTQGARRVAGAEPVAARLAVCDLAKLGFVAYAEHLGAAGRRARGPEPPFRAACDTPGRPKSTVGGVPAGRQPAPADFIHMPKVRG